jgi:hypothetical protein
MPIDFTKIGCFPSTMRIMLGAVEKWTPQA